MKHDPVAITTIALIITILCAVIYLQHLEICKLIDKAGAQGKWARAIDAVGEPIDHIYIETRPRVKK